MLEALTTLPPPQTLARLCDASHISHAIAAGRDPLGCGGIADTLQLLQLAGSVIFELGRYHQGATAVAASQHLSRRLLLPHATAKLLANASWMLHFILNTDDDDDSNTTTTTNSNRPHPHQRRQALHPYSHYARAQLAGLNALGCCLTTLLLPTGDAHKSHTLNNNLATQIAEWGGHGHALPLPDHSPPELVEAAQGLLELAAAVPCLPRRVSFLPAPPRLARLPRCCVGDGDVWCYGGGGGGGGGGGSSSSSSSGGGSSPTGSISSSSGGGSGGDGHGALDAGLGGGLWCA
jgi:hypothetical protein